MNEKRIRYMLLTGAVILMACGAAMSFYGARRQAQAPVPGILQEKESSQADYEVYHQTAAAEETEGMQNGESAGGGQQESGQSGEAAGGGQQESGQSGEAAGGGRQESGQSGEPAENGQPETEAQRDYIKWVDFDVTCQALTDAYNCDVDTYGAGIHLNWIELLAYLAAKYGGDFSSYKKADLDALTEALQQGGETMETLTEDKKYYPYYLEAYTAVLGGLVGEYEIQVPAESNPDVTHWEQKYGLRAFSPIARGYEYSDYDDFGAARSYGYRRQHLGHDMMGQTGTPIIAIESGTVEALGWNQYGGWRIGIRSFDKKRYYYYAHLRQNFPFNKSLEEGSVVTAGDVIGYLGHTGYSAKENVNNIDEPHLHWGLQLIFDESQKEGNNEIWIDCYALTRFLSRNRCTTRKNMETKEYYRVYDMRIPEYETE